MGECPAEDSGEEPSLGKWMGGMKSLIDEESFGRLRLLGVVDVVIFGELIQGGDVERGGDEGLTRAEEVVAVAGLWLE